MQELYKHDESKPRYNEEESQNVPAGFHFTLDEETQFEEILDSQGLIHIFDYLSCPVPLEYEMEFLPYKSFQLITRSHSLPISFQFVVCIDLKFCLCGLCSFRTFIGLLKPKCCKQFSLHAGSVFMHYCCYF